MPSIQLVFSANLNQPLLVRPQQYMVEFPTRGAQRAPSGARHYCVAVFDNQRAGTVIGASIMRQREVRGRFLRRHARAPDCVAPLVVRVYASRLRCGGARSTACPSPHRLPVASGDL